MQSYEKKIVTTVQFKYTWQWTKAVVGRMRTGKNLIISLVTEISPTVWCNTQKWSGITMIILVQMGYLKRLMMRFSVIFFYFTCFPLCSSTAARNTKKKEINSTTWGSVFFVFATQKLWDMLSTSLLCNSYPSKFIDTQNVLNMSGLSYRCTCYR